MNPPWDPNTPTWAFRLAIVTLVLWSLFGGLCVYTAPELMQNTGATLSPPENSRSGVANSLSKEYFKNMTGMGSVLDVVLEVEKGGEINKGDNKLQVTQFQRWLSELVERSEFNQQYVIQVSGYYLPSIDGSPVGWMLSTDNTTTITRCIVENTRNHHKVSENDAFRFINFIQREYTNCSILGQDIELTFSGGNVLTLEMKGRAVSSLRKMEVIVLPFAFAVLSFFLRRFQLLIIPLICMGLSFGTSFTLALPIAKRWGDVSSETPEVMISAAVALSIDYSLFLLRRYVDELDIGTSQWNAVQKMLRHSGHTVSLSGFLISLAFFSGVLLPLATIRAAGICTGITAVATVLCNLTATPALLIIFGQWFTKPFPYTMVGFRCKKRSESYKKITQHPKLGKIWSVNASINSLPEVSAPSDSYLHEDLDIFECAIKDDSSPSSTDMQHIQNTFWYKFGVFIHRHATLVIVIIAVLGIPLMYNLKDFKVSENRFLTRPRDSKSESATLRMQKAGIAPGRLQPYSILIIGSDMWSDVGFKALSDLGDSVIIVTNNSKYIKNNPLVVDYRILEGPAHLWGRTLTFSEAQKLSLNDSDYRKLLKKHSSGHNATATNIFTPFVPYGARSSSWVREMRDQIDEVNRRYLSYGIQAHLLGGDDVDSSDVVMKTMPQVVAIIISTVMVIVAVAFQSLVLPFRLALALSFTIAVTLSVAVIVYQTSLFWWLFPYLKEFECEGLSYSIPAIVVPVCISLGIDYDVFLLTRIFEYRLSGMSDEDSIVIAMAKTGSAISGAGFIMCVAFGGLLASTETMLNQFGFVLTVSVFLDTFVIRTILVPALMIKASRWNWWPRTMPPASTSYSIIPKPTEDTLEWNDDID